jgi:hypothetical protein
MSVLTCSWPTLTIAWCESSDDRRMKRAQMERGAWR